VAFDKYYQDPADVLDYSIDWQGGATPFLPPGVEIVSSTWAAYDTSWQPSDDITIVSDDHDETTTTVRLSDIAARVYVTNHIAASDGQEKDQTIQINMKEQ
jgi:hypothetical protein